MLPSRVVGWGLGCFSIACAAGSLSERQEDCEARGGSLIWVALQMSQYFGQDFFEALLVEPAKDDSKEAKNHICVPRNCAGHEQISTNHCATVKGWVLQTLLEAHQHMHGGLGYDHVFQTKLLQIYPWMLKGIEEHFVPQPLFPLTACMHCISNVRVSASELPGRLRIAVWSSHAPLAAVLAEHVEAVVEEPQIVYYGMCYLCEQTSTCLERHQDSMADQSCGLFPQTRWHTAEVVVGHCWGCSAERGESLIVDVFWPCILPFLVQPYGWNTQVATAVHEPAARDSTWFCSFDAFGLTTTSLGSQAWWSGWIASGRCMFWRDGFQTQSAFTHSCL